MDKRIIALLIVMATITVAGVYAGGFVSHDFGQFKMDVPDCNAEITENVSENYTTYAIPNADGSLFAYVDYMDNTHIKGNNTTDFALNKIKENYTVEIKDGIAVWDYPETHEHGYLISSEDDTKVLIFQSSDVTLPDVFDSIEFK